MFPEKKYKYIFRLYIERFKSSVGAYSVFDIYIYILYAYTFRGKLNLTFTMLRINRRDDYIIYIYIDA